MILSIIFILNMFIWNTIPDIGIPTAMAFLLVFAIDIQCWSIINEELHVTTIK